MARKGKIKKRELIPDSKYNNFLVAKLISKLLLEGKKGRAETIMYSALDIMKEKLKKDEIEILEAAIKNVAPELEVKSRRVGGATYQVPLEVSDDRKSSLAIKWIIDYARAKKGQPMHEKLAAEIMDAYNNVGSAMKKREDTHKMAEANKAFAHYRW